MTVATQNIVNRVRRLLQDAEGTRWIDAELVDWVNDAQREVVLLKPDASAVTESFACATGTKQMLPAGAVTLLDVTRNLAGTQRAVRYVSRHVLDSELPTWHAATPSAEIRHFVFDERQATTFYVYPPAVATTPIEVVYAKSPTDTTLAGNLTLPDVYANIVADYVMYRALSKDADYAGNQDLALSYQSRYMAALTGKEAQEAASDPLSRALFNRGAAQRGS